MKIVFRVDASLKIGTGHVMRCLSLAEELRRRGSRVIFVCRLHAGNLCEEIAFKGFEIIKLGLVQGVAIDNHSRIKKDIIVHQPTHSFLLGVDQNLDAVQTSDSLKKHLPCDWLIVDHYALDVKWESAMQGVAKKIMAIDDLADRKHDCDILLDQNYFKHPAIRYKGLLPKQCQSLLGPHYALIRPEIRQATKFCRMRGNGIIRVLIYFGGNDPENLTGIVLEALSSPELRYLLVEVVIGPNNAHKEKLEKQVQKRQGTRLSIQPEAFVELMLRTDLCIGAGGTTTWERLCLGLPSIVITVAKNQEPFTKELDQAGYVTWIGIKEQITVIDLKRQIVDEIVRINSPVSVTSSPNLVDGNGTLRVIEKIIPSSKRELSLRRATIDDMEQYFIWANDPIVRKNSFLQKTISWEEHVQWFTRKIISKKTEMWVLQTAHGVSVGQVRFDIEESIADIGYSLDSIARGRDWGLKLLEMGNKKIRKYSNCKVIQGKVKKENISSRKIFMKLGFSEAKENNIYVFTKELMRK